MFRILIIEDDPTITEVLSRNLCKCGYDAQSARDFSDILAYFSAFAPHLVLLDISLPFYNGFYWCGEIRKQSQTPIIFLSSASDNMNQVIALSMGADDFIAKPFDLEVLVAKVQAILRRTYHFASGSQKDALEHKGAVLDIGGAALLYGGQKIELTKNELKILQLLLENKGKVVSRDAIMKRLWESESFIDDNTLTVNIARLRKKLEGAGLSDFIKTKKGLGYLAEEGR